VLHLCALAALAGAAQDPPPRPLKYQAVPIGADAGMTLTVTEEPGLRPRLLIAGRLDRPDGTILKLTLLDLRERVESGRLLERAEDAGAAVARVTGGAFAGTRPVHGPGRFRIRIDQIEEFQPEELLPALRALPGPLHWNFELRPVGLLGRVRLEEDLERTRDCIGTVRRAADEIERAAADARGFRDALRRLKSDRKYWTFESGARSFSASHHELGNLCSSLEVMIQFFWDDRGQWNPVPGAPDPPLIRGRRVTLPLLREALDEAEEVAGRELALWVLKDASVVGHSPAHEELLVKCARFPGVGAAFDAPESLVRKLPERR
jgi:hypothetical protein